MSITILTVNNNKGFIKRLSNTVLVHGLPDRSKLRGAGAVSV